MRRTKSSSTNEMNCQLRGLSRQGDVTLGFHFQFPFRSSVYPHIISFVHFFTAMSSSSSTDDEESTPPLQFTRQTGRAIASKIIPEGGWGWMICAAAFVTQLIVMGIHNSFGILYTTLLQEYQKSKAETGKLNVSFFVQKKQNTSTDLQENRVAFFFAL